MKKNTLIFILFIFSVFNIKSQSLLPNKYGIKFGIEIANINSIPEEYVKNISVNPNIGFSGGFCIQIPFNQKWKLNTEILYTQKSLSFNYDYKHDYLLNSRDMYKTTNDMVLSYASLNPILSFPITTKFKLNFGPTIGFLINSDYTYSESPENILLQDKGKFKEQNLDIGVNFGISYNLTESLMIDLRNYTGLTEFGKISTPIDILSDSHSYTFKNKSFNLGFIYLF